MVLLWTGRYFLNSCASNELWFCFEFQISQHFKDGYLHKDEFKIVYVAPMKVNSFQFGFKFSGEGVGMTASFFGWCCTS